MDAIPSSNPAPPIHPVRYSLIWFLNVLVAGLAILFFILTDTATREFYDIEGLIFFAIPALMATTLVAAFGTVIFFLTIFILGKQKRNPRIFRLWLGGPAWLFAFVVTLYALWNLTPHQQLKKVCWGTTVPARNIKVAGCVGMQISEWLADFEIQPGDFQKLVGQQQLQPDSPEHFSSQFQRAGLIKRTALFRNMPSTSNWECFKREMTGVDGRIHGGIYAAYDSRTTHAVVFHDGY
jgi:hypothetical protein